MDEDVPVVVAAVAVDEIDAGNESAGPEPDESAPPKENDGVAKVFAEGVVVDSAFPKLSKFVLDLLASELILVWAPPGFKLIMLVPNFVEVTSPKLLFPAGANEFEVFCPVGVDPKENDVGIVAPPLVAPKENGAVEVIEPGNNEK